MAVVLSVGTFLAACRCLLYSAAAPMAWLHFAGLIYISVPLDTISTCQECACCTVLWLFSRAYGLPALCRVADVCWEHLIISMKFSMGIARKPELLLLW